MNYVLRPYQQKGKNELRKKLSEGKNKIIYYAATGSGKGLSMADVAKDAVKKGSRVLVIMRRRSLIVQTVDNFKKYIGIEPHAIMGSYKGSGNLCIVVSSIDTLYRRINKPDYNYLKSYEVIIIDEAHDTTSDSYRATIRACSPKAIIGFTATPYSIGSRTHDFWDDYICPITPSELRDQGYLAPCDVYAPGESISVKDVKKSAGDYNQKDLFSAASRPSITGSIVKTYKLYGKGLPAICFCVNKRHAKMICDEFKNHGITAGYADDQTSIEYREHLIKQVKKGLMKVICNVNIFSTGIDIPEISVAILARPTMSLVLYVQQVGRALRIHPNKKTAIILDHAGNTLRHGLPFDYREPEMERQKKRSKTHEIKVKTCESCFYMFSPAPVCPACGHENKKQDRDIKIIDGELSLVKNINSRKVDEFTEYRDELRKLQYLETQYQWKPAAKYFKLFEKYGNGIFKYCKELGIPAWFRKLKSANTPVTRDF